MKKNILFYIMNLILNVNSLTDRMPTESTSKWTTFLANTIKVKTGNKLTFKIEQIEVPNSVYSFPYYSSKFYYYYNYGGPNEEVRSLQLPTDRLFVNGTEIASFLNTIANDSWYNIVFTYDSLSGKISVTNNETSQIKIASAYWFDNLADNVADRLGFIDPDIVLPSNAIYKPSGCIRLLPTQCYYLCCNVLSHPKMGFQNFQPSPYVKHPPILARITSGNFATLSQLSYSSDVEMTVKDTSEITMLQFVVLDDQFHEIDLLGNPVTFSIKITID